MSCVWAHCTSHSCRRCQTRDHVYYIDILAHFRAVPALQSKENQCGDPEATEGPELP